MTAHMWLWIALAATGGTGWLGAWFTQGWRFDRPGGLLDRAHEDGADSGYQEALDDMRSGWPGRVKDQPGRGATSPPPLPGYPEGKAADARPVPPLREDPVPIPARRDPRGQAPERPRAQGPGQAAGLPMSRLVAYNELRAEGEWEPADTDVLA